MRIELTAAEFREVFGRNPATIKATLTKYTHDGCDGCKFLGKREDEYPCIVCKQNFMDMHEKGGDE